MFGGEGVEGPPGQINVPIGRGILGYSNGQIFGVPAPDGSADGVTVLQMDPSSADFFKLPKIPDNNGGGSTGYILQWEESEGGYTLRPPPVEWPDTGGDLALVGVDSAGIPQAYPFGFAGDGAIPRVVGTSIAFSQLFNAKGLVIAAANGSHSYLQQQGIVYTAADGTVYNLTVGPDLRINGSNLETEPTEVARLSGGRLLPAQRSGWVVGTFDSTPVATQAASFTLLTTLSIPGCQVGDVLVYTGDAELDNNAPTFFYGMGCQIRNASSTIVVNQPQTKTMGGGGRPGTLAMRKYVIATAGTHTIELTGGVIAGTAAGNNIRQAHLWAQLIRPNP